MSTGTREFLQLGVKSEGKKKKKKKNWKQPKCPSQEDDSMNSDILAPRDESIMSDSVATGASRINKDQSQTRMLESKRNH